MFVGMGASIGVPISEVKQNVRNIFVPLVACVSFGVLAPSVKRKAKLMTQVYRYHSARARVREIGGGVHEIEYTGAMTPKAFHALREDVLEATRGAQALVIRVDRGFFAMAQIRPSTRSAYAHNDAPGAVVGRQDQLGYWVDYSMGAAEIGIMRAVFLDSQMTMALEWARRHARVFPSISPR